MKVIEWIAHFFEKYALLICLIFEALLLLFSLTANIALICLAPAWRVVGWFGIAGLVIILGVLAYGIIDELRHLKR